MALTHKDGIFCGMNTLPCELTDAPNIACDSHLRSITELRCLFQWWADPAQASPDMAQSIHQKPHSCTTKLVKQRHSCQPPTLQPKMNLLPHIQGCTAQKRMHSFQECSSQWQFHQLQRWKHSIQGCILHTFRCTPVRMTIQLNLLLDARICITLKQDHFLMNPLHDAHIHTQLTLFPLLEHQDNVTRANFALTESCL